MLRKMYLVSADRFHKDKRPPSVTKLKASRKRNKKKEREHPYEKWFKYREKMREADIKRKTQIQSVADFLKKVLPKRSYSNQLRSPSPKESRQSTPRPSRRLETPPRPSRRLESLLSPPAIAATSKEVIYETPTHRPFPEPEDDDDDDDEEDDDFAEEDVQAFGRENVGTTASPYIVPYFYNRRFLDTQYGIRKVGNSFMIGDSAVLVDTDSDITIKGQEFRGTKGLWELLTRKKVNRKLITSDDLKKYKKILILTNAHLTDYQPGSDIQITRGSKFQDVISQLFPQTRRRGIESALLRRWVKY